MQTNLRNIGDLAGNETKAINLTGPRLNLGEITVMQTHMLSNIKVAPDENETGS